MINHDYANLVCMPVLGSLCVAACLGVIPCNFVLGVLLAYMVLDVGTPCIACLHPITPHNTVWIAAVPTCVPKAPLILVHHVVTITLTIIALCYLERIGFWACLDGTVEVNTFFLIARRTFPIKSWQPLFDKLYWVTWVPLRLFMYVEGATCCVVTRLRATGTHTYCTRSLYNCRMTWCWCRCSTHVRRFWWYVCTSTLCCLMHMAHTGL